MAEPRDHRVSAAYRELPAEGPPPALDAAIQAAARRSVNSRPGGVRRWGIPVSIAAVLALAIGISLHVEREKPLVVDGTPVQSGTAEYPVPQAPPETADRPAAERQSAAPAAPTTVPSAAERAAKPALATPTPEAKRIVPEPARADMAAPAPATTPPLTPAPMIAPAPMAMPASPAPPSQSANNVPAPAAAPAARAAVSEGIAAVPQSAPRAKSEAARDGFSSERRRVENADAPEKQLERIADLRARGLHDEADKALAEFRRAQPDYRISDEWLRKVQRP
jgi:hypothetical protein